MAEKRVGRPPAGRDEKGNPVPVSGFKPTTIRLPPRARAGLDALAVLLGKDRSSVIVEALEALIEGLPAEDRKTFDALRRRLT